MRNDQNVSIAVFLIPLPRPSSIKKEKKMFFRVFTANIFQLKVLLIYGGSFWNFENIIFNCFVKKNDGRKEHVLKSKMN